MDTISHILIVDDDREIRSLLADYLNNNGYLAHTAENGSAMWKALEDAHIDLIVLDLNLPGDDGLTLCRNLRAKSEMPVIMLTARSEPLDRILGLEMGADDYLPKPFEPDSQCIMRSDQQGAGGRCHRNAVPAARFAFAQHGWRHAQAIAQRIARGAAGAGSNAFAAFTARSRRQWRCRMILLFA